MKLSLALLATAAAIAFAPAPATAADLDTLVKACRQEALRGHMRVGRLLPVTGPQVTGHRGRMLAICEDWRKPATDALLARCEREAAKGPRVLHNGRDLDRDHVARQKRLCRDLAAAK